MTRRGRAVIFVAIVALAVGFDQGSKAWARNLPVVPIAAAGPGGTDVRPARCVVPGDLIAGRCAGVPQPVIAGFWDWELAENPGAAFSSFTGATTTQILLSLVALAALLGLGIAAARTRPEQRIRLAALALIAGGALGNLIDRVRDGAVTDFVRWRIHDHRWPIFNVADAALLVGVAVLLAERALGHRRGRAISSPAR
jgi:signal peptidase II